MRICVNINACQLFAAGCRLDINLIEFGSAHGTVLMTCDQHINAADLFQDAVSFIFTVQ